MRLKKLKLAGFKSFVDPTTIGFPSQLLAIVGPNGCGKSNIIDAVRWVMGESSAKHLRGESMADVIFSGSQARKPVGQAHVELIFDNSDGSSGGEYAQYDEISVKRQVTRDGQSSYYLNGVKCRRRDITHIILGTGVGPRSYAIIEQGMISRLIEAKPEELRVYLEEVAGISKYKERRRETENRIRHTRENLERLEDLRDEIGKQLEHLQRQARTAERFKQLNTEKDHKEAELKAIRWRDLDQGMASEKQDLQQLEVNLEQQVAGLRNVEANLEELRVNHTSKADELQVSQANFYKQGAEVNRLEQQIQYNLERSQQLQNSLAQLEQQVEENQQQLLVDEQQLETLNEMLANTEPELERLATTHQAAAEKLQHAENELATWQQQWDELQQGSAEHSKSCEVEQTRIEHLDKSLAEVKRRVERLQLDQRNLAYAEVAAAIESLQLAQAECLERVDTSEESLHQMADQIKQQRDANEHSSERLDLTRKEEQTLRGRIASLEALQQAALGQHNKDLSKWLDEQQLADNQRLAEQLTVANGWELAVETVLGTTLQAVCVDALDQYSQQLASLEQGEATLLTASVSHGESSLGADSLLSKISSNYDLRAFCAKVRCADDLDSALAMRGSLADDESVITKDGLWLGKSWIRVKKASDEQSGTIVRQQELQQAKESLLEAEALEQNLSAELQHGKDVLQSLESERELLQTKVNEEQQELANVQASLNAKQGQEKQLKEREEAIVSELEECHERIETESVVVSEARLKLEQLIELMAEDNSAQEKLQESKQGFVDALQHERTLANTAKEDFVAHQARLQGIKAEHDRYHNAVERMQRQLQQLQEQRQQQQGQLAEVSDPEEQLQEQLKEALEQRLVAEKTMHESRDQTETLALAVRDAEKQRGDFEQGASTAREKLEKLRLNQQAVQVRKATIEESFQELPDLTLEQVVASLPPDASEQPWAEDIERLAGKISRLGAINLAAIEEYDAQSERKTYLDAQHDDLISALETLEEAIAKIDKETRATFKETYDFVNNSLQELFPRMFGGGEAYLELIGDDLLEAGVAIMARPPGKRNSTIHLLSGGEKALTTIALVFSLFRLNPAPFCLLDEVDAPLDDANVVRLTRLVKEMSDTVQFIIITHNKITMDLGEQLMGVTMREPGVSRIVSVDMAEAAELAGA